LLVAEAALDKKATRIEIIDVRDKVDYADYVIVMSGRSDRQVGAIARGIEEDLKLKHGTRCAGVEGLPQGNWVLLDFGDVVVHIFHQEMRGFYDLEGLWLDAARVEFEGQQADDGFAFP
jgi:ribosome-associated protein